MPSLAETIVPLYRRHAAAFARRRSDGRMERPWLERFLALVPPGGAVLDLGCGTGEPIAGYMRRRGFEVTGVDASPEMIALARANFPEGDWRVADMRGLELRRRFDGLLAWDSFFHLDAAAQRAMFPVFRAHAAPGAALMFTSGPAAGEAIGEFEGEPLFHASLDPGEYQALLGANGFTEFAFVAEDPDCGRHTIWLARAS